MFLKFSDGRYINSKYIEAFGIKEDKVSGKIEPKRNIWIRLSNDTLYNFDYGNNHYLNAIDYKHDKAMLEDLAEMKED